MNKFKPGDVVVVIADSPSDPWSKKGNRGIIERSHSMYIGEWLVRVESNMMILNIQEEEMEHAEIVDSPLYKALL